MKKLLIVLVALGMVSCFENKNNQPKVETTSGVVCGKTSLDGSVEMFLGIPFAEPPIGDLRFSAPKPIQKRQKEISCVDMPASPMQYPPNTFECWDMNFQIPPSPISEDCLYLNIFKPKNVAENEKLPVFVWIHGGGFTSGSGTLPLYSGENFVKNNVIYVSINYRIGIFGFFAHPDLSKESKEGISGNYGILDQIEALKWINENIEKFSGDKNNITIAGQSAGAYSVNALMVSPKAKGLFQKAVLLSGGFLSKNPMFCFSKSDGENFGKQFAESHSLTIDKMRKMSADSLLSLNFYPANMIVDEKVICNPRQVFLSGQQNCRTIICGYTETDGVNFQKYLNKEDYVKAACLRENVPANDFLKFFPAENDSQAFNSQKVYNRLNGFGFESWLLAKMNAESGGKSYMYMFYRKFQDEKKYGVFHSTDLAYFLDNLSAVNRNLNESDYKLKDYIQKSLKSFLYDSKIPDWLPFDTENPKVMRLDSVSKPMDFVDLEQCKFLERM